jgi:predicted DNA-binding transcriptional regulator YafY
MFLEGDQMKGLLLNAKNHGFALKMIYMNDQGVITERFITVKDFNDHYIRAYCHFRKTFRTFKRSNILSIGLAKQRMGA